MNQIRTIIAFYDIVMSCFINLMMHEFQKMIDNRKFIEWNMHHIDNTNRFMDLMNEFFKYEYVRQSFV